MVLVLEIISLVLLLDIVRRVHDARGRFQHRQGYSAWMTFLLISVASLGVDVAATLLPAEDVSAALLSIRAGMRVAAISALWIAISISMPGSFGQRVLEVTRFGVKGPESVGPLQPPAPESHSRSAPSNGPAA